jgi:serine/threonine protein kinase
MMESEETRRLAATDRLAMVLDACRDAIDRGKADLQTWIAKYPEFSTELTEMFADRASLDWPTASMLPAAQVSQMPTITGTEAAALLGFDLPCRFADYELLEQLGRGGSGVVFKARQLSLNRPVALKVFAVDSLALTAERQRFRREAEIAAHLDHPNIVPIHEVGECEGRLFFSMKLLEGGSLAKACRGMKRDHADQRASARLVAAIARAVHYAHQRGILHRDLKPANILLERRDGDATVPTPYVSDFGLARWVATDSGLTQSGAVLGTPGYMAPEQASGQPGMITTATDVYGLGAILYTLLTGRPPFHGANVLDTLVQARAGEPEAPGSVNRLLDRDVETICLKCLEKEPARRYISAEALADDLERWLDGQPIQARPLSSWERASRWCRRNPVAAGMAAALLLVLLAASTVSTWQAIRATQAETQAKSSQDLAQERFALAKNAVDFYLNKIAEMEELKGPNYQRLRKQLLEKAILFYQQLAEQAPGDGEQEAAQAGAYLGLGGLRAELGDHTAAIADLEKARDFFGRLGEAFPGNPTHRQDLAGVYTTMGRILQQKGQPADSEAAHRKSVETLQKLVGDFPAVADYRRALAGSQLELAALLGFVSRPGEAEVVERQALAIRRQLVQEHPDVPDYHDELAVTLAQLANELRRREPTTARALLEEARTHHETALKANPSLPRYRETYAHNRVFLGFVLGALNQLDAAKAAFQTALDIRQHLADEFPQYPRYRTALADGYFDSASVLRTTGQMDEAFARYQTAMTIHRDVTELYPGLPNYRQALAQRYTGLGIVLAELKRTSEAEAVFRETISIQQQLIRRFPQVPDY